MKQLNPKSHRLTESNKKRTKEIIETYYGKNDLLRTWEQMPDKVQIKFHTDIIKLRARVRNVKNYINHRASADAEI